MKFTRIFAAIAVASSLAFSVSAQADDSFTDAQKTQIQGVIHDYLMKNPNEIERTRSCVEECFIIVQSK
jgi:hypothetical protein